MFDIRGNDHAGGEDPIPLPPDPQFRAHPDHDLYGVVGMRGNQVPPADGEEPSIPQVPAKGLFAGFGKG
jgi:hypothetical protein